MIASLKIGAIAGIYSAIIEGIVVSGFEMNIDKQELERAALSAGVSREQAEAIWQGLQKRPAAQGHFEPAHVGYYFGALLVIGAMGWFMTNGWDSFHGWQLFLIASGYATIFLLVGSRVWVQPQFKVAGGLLVTIAVCMTPLAVYGIERQFKLWPAPDPGSYTKFHPYINASWVWMEIATVCTVAIALKYFRFPFLTAPAAYALWFMSMDLSALIYGKGWQWREECIISTIFGVGMLLVSYGLDGRTELDFSFWGYLFGLLTFTGGLSLIDSGNQWAKLGYCVIHVGLIVISLILRRRVFLVFGGLGVFGYLTNEAYTYFRDSVAFPFVLSLIGVLIVFGAMKYKKSEKALQERIAAWIVRKPTAA